MGFKIFFMIVFPLQSVLDNVRIKVRENRTQWTFLKLALNAHVIVHYCLMSPAELGVLHS